MSLTPSEVASLTKALSRWEVAEYICAGFVTIGCIGEYIADFTDWFTRGIKERKERLAKRSTLLLISALAIELICLVRTNELSGRVIGSLDDRSKEAVENSTKALDNAKSAQSKADKATDAASAAMILASGARREADSFAQSIASAKQQATEAKKGTARITDRLADRILTDDQVVAISNAVRAFAGQEFDITPYWELKESMALANRIADSLAKGGWKYVPPDSAGFMLGGTAGVHVFVHPAASERTKNAASVLVSALTKEGIESAVRLQNPKNPVEAKLHLNVGTKP